MKGYRTGDFIKLLYIHNPFYLISSGLILYGLQMAFARGGLGEPWVLASALLALALLLGATAVCIVRYGRVWEDARSIMLVLPLLFFATSISFDQLCTTDPDSARWLLGLSFAGSMLITEGVLWSLQIRLRILFRLPYYCMFALLFIYPTTISPAIVGLDPTTVSWRVMLFSVLAAGALLMLVPAVRMTSAYVADNGTPWHWPLFPWTLFGFLGLVLIVRVYVLGVSFLPIAGLGSAFDAYFLLPVAFAVLILLLETAIVERRELLQRLLLVTAPLIAFAAIPWLSSPHHNEFLLAFTAAAAAPLWLCFTGLIGFYGVAMLRRLRGSEVGLVGCLLIIMFIEPNRVKTELPFQYAGTLVNYWPLMAIGSLQLLLAVTRGSSCRCFMGSLAVFAATWLAMGSGLGTIYELVVAGHLLMLAALITGLLYDDCFAKNIRLLAALLLALSSALFMFGGGAVGASELVRLAYGAGATTLLLVWWHYRGERWLLVASACTLVTLLSGGLLPIFGPAKQTMGWPAVIAITSGCCLFMLAVLISAYKGGMLDNAHQSWSEMIDRVERRGIKQVE